MDLLKNKLALVTGAGGGLGTAIAEGFAREGARVVVADLDLALAKATAQGIQDAGGQAWAEQLDVTDRESVNRFAQRVQQDIGAIDILVNNAGISGKSRIDEATAPEVWDRILNVNLQGLFNVTHTPHSKYH